MLLMFIGAYAIVMTLILSKVIVDLHCRISDLELKLDNVNFKAEVAYQKADAATYTLGI